MHDGHDHPHRPAARAGQGHNRSNSAAQWQGPPRTAGGAPELPRDFDLVEAAFCRAADAADDPTSLLRLAGVPFVARDGEGRTLRLLRYQIHDATEVGTATPGFEAAGVVYQPLPASRVRRNRRLAFVYLGDAGERELSLAEARRLTDITPDGPA